MSNLIFKKVITGHKTAFILYYNFNLYNQLSVIYCDLIYLYMAYGCDIYWHLYMQSHCQSNQVM